MRRTTPLTAAALLGLAAPLLAIASTAADATAPTCQGQPATVVASGRSITGTEGPDVVMTGGATSVRPLGGNDLVCATGTAKAYIHIEAGDGDDIVDATQAPAGQVVVALGSGTDSFSGGGEDDRVTLDYPDSGAGPDVVHGGGGSDALYLQTGPGAAVIDNATGRFTRAGELRTTWSGLETFWLSNEPSLRDLTVVGSDAAERVYDGSYVATRVDVDLRGGDDAWHSGYVPTDTSVLRGGAGRDLLYVASETAGSLDLDMRDGLLKVGGVERYELAADDFEDAEVFADQVTLAGTNGPNDLGVTACTGRVRGRAGDDRIWRSFEGAFESFDLDCSENLTFNGGSGNDELSGSRGADKLLGGKGRDRLNGKGGSDRLIGGRGHDHLSGKDQGDTLLGGRGNDFADGGRGGRDVCRAERTRQCER